MTRLSALLIARRLRELVTHNFFCQSFNSDVLYVREHLAEIRETSETLTEQYEYHLQAFVQIAARFIGNKEQMEDLVLISDPFVIDAFNAVFHRSVKMLETEGETQSYFVPDSDKAFFKKFIFLSMRFREDFKHLFG